MKIAVMGYSGAGKSTLARALGEWYGISVLHMDRVHHTSGWQVRNRDEAHRMVHEFMEQSQWVIDGNYTKFEYRRRLAEADEIILLEFPRLICFARAFRRSIRYKGKTRPDMAEGCTEKMDLEFMGRLLWKGCGKQKKCWLSEGLAENLDKVTVLKSQKEIDQYLEDLKC